MKETNDNFVRKDGDKKPPQPAKFRGTLVYWEKTVRRLSVFAGCHIPPGVIENGRIDLCSRVYINFIFDNFMAKYKDVKTEANRPFNNVQEAEIKRVLAGGFLMSKADVSARRG